MGCLTDNQLGALVEGSLADSAPEWAHLAECSACARLLSSLADHALAAPRRGPLESTVAVEGRPWAGRFTLVRRVGGGRRGVTFEALDGATRIALQVLVRPVDGTWAKTAGPLLSWRHPTACGVHAVGVFEGQAWVASEWVGGATSLRGAARGWAEAWPLFRDAADALAAAHDAGLVHGAVSLGSVLARREGRAVLGDFGLVHAPEARADQQLLLSRLEPASPAGDQRAFTRALWACLAGSARAPLPSTVPAHVGAALEAGLASDFQGLRALAEALDR